jgi:hypothetical protein
MKVTCNFLPALYMPWLAGVPVLLVNNQISVYVIDNNAQFTCVESVSNEQLDLAGRVVRTLIPSGPCTRKAPLSRVKHDGLLKGSL